MSSAIAQSVAQKFKLGGDKVKAPEFDLNTTVDAASRETGVPSPLIHAVVQQESTGKQNALSITGAQGLMQLMPETAAALGVNPKNPEQNIFGGATYLKQMYDKFGSWDLALAAYNAGPGNVEKYGGIPPFAETQKYVPEVLNKAGIMGDKLANTPTELGAKVLNKFNNRPQKLMPTPPIEPQQSPLLPGLPVEPKSTGIAGGTLAASKSYLDALGVGFLERQLGKIPGAKKASESLYNAILGENKPFEQRAQEMQAVTKQAQKEHPIASGAGTVAGVLAPIGVSSLAGKAASGAVKATKLASIAPRAATVAKLLGAGAAEAGAFEAATNAEATPESIAHAAKVGAVVSGIANPASKIAAKALKSGSEQLINFAVGAKVASKTGKFVAEELGPTLSRAGLKSKVEQSLITNEANLQRILADHSDKTINLRKIVQESDILKGLESLDNVEQRAKATKLIKILAKLETRGEIGVQEANLLKRDLYKQAYIADSVKLNPKVKTPLGQMYRQIANKLKTGIEDVTGDGEVRALNEKLGSGIELGKSLDRLDNQSPLSLRMAFQLMAGLSTGGGSLLATSTPGATLLGTAGYKTGKSVEKLSPQIQQILSTLVPQVGQ